MKGQFIVIEGLEGAGKSTAVNTVKTWVEAHGKIAQLVREPGGIHRSLKRYGSS